MIDTTDFVRVLADVMRDRMGDVVSAEPSDNWPDDDEAIRVELTDGQHLAIDVRVTR
jgi:hypothetical protein